MQALTLLTQQQLIGEVARYAGPATLKVLPSRDVTRLNALEWRDERDRTLAKSGFAVVGAVALLMVLVQFIVAISVAAIDSPFVWAAITQLTILCVVWGVANSVVVRRG